MDTRLPDGDELEERVFLENFIGRSEALQAFDWLFSSHHMISGVYYWGRGGQGKTYLLRFISFTHRKRSGREVAETIDFFDTANHNKRGLQASIMRRMNRDEIFEPYCDVLAEIEKEKEKEREKRDAPPGIVTGLEKRADREFIRCCKQASLKRELVLIFDTLEKVQNQEAGRWLLEDFLPNVKTPKIVLAGRPEPELARVPLNIRSFELQGFESEEAKEHLRKLAHEIADEQIDLIHKRTGGSPLIMNLIVGEEIKVKEDLLREIAHLPPGVLVQDSERRCMLVSRHQENNAENRALWIMAFLKRRFDLRMLEEIARRRPEWFRESRRQQSIQDIYQSLCDKRIVKHYSRQESHLLHDEVQRLLAECVLGDGGNPRWRAMQQEVYDLIVEYYYPQVLIKNAASTVECNQYEAERLGYWLDRDPEQGAAKYLELRDSSPFDYDREELLWLEVRNHLHRFPDQGKALSWDRRKWLRVRNLFAKADRHAEDMLTYLPEDAADIKIGLGFTYMRRGKITDAERIVDEVLRDMPEEDYRVRGEAHNVRGQIAYRAGKWDEALRHYALGFRVASLGRLPRVQASVYINRTHLYSLQGFYDLSESHCLIALNLLNGLKAEENKAPDGGKVESDDPLIQREIYAWMHLGTVRRHKGEYDLALQDYQKCLEIAEKSHNLEAQCIVHGHMGINLHLRGRNLRLHTEGLSPEELASACTDQHQAWNHLIEALVIAQRSDYQSVVADALNRLAKVYREIYQLLNLPKESLLQATQVQKKLMPLVEQASGYRPILDDDYPSVVFPEKTFDKLEWREKAARLFEMSARVAEEDNYYHRALDSRMELLRTLLWLRQLDKIQAVIDQLAEIKGFDYQGELFTAMAEISEADLKLKNGEFEPAFEMYQKAYIDLANQTSIAYYLLQDRLRDLELRLREDVPADRRVDWCNRLEERWLEAGLAIRHPEMIEKLENLRLEFLENF